MKLSTASSFIASANAGVAPANGLYLLYTVAKNTPIPTESGAVISVGSLDTIKSSVNTSAGELGLCRIPGILVDVTSGGSPGSGAIVSGGFVFSSGYTYTFYGNTGNHQDVCGLPFSAGVYARAVTVAHLDRGSIPANNYMYDTGLNYDELTTPVVAPANGGITIIEEVNL